MGYPLRCLWMKDSFLLYSKIIKIKRKAKAKIILAQLSK